MTDKPCLQIDLEEWLEEKKMTDKPMTVGYVPALKYAGDSLIKEIALDIGKEVVHHIELMYPEMFKAVAGSAKLSVRNCVYEEILGAIQVNDEGQIIARLERRKKFRRKIKSFAEGGSE